jgi:hypothetical protein
MSLREAAQQALEALEDIADELISPYNDPIGKAILDLRTALAEPEQTFMAEYKFRTYGYYQDADGKMQVGEIPEEMLTVSVEELIEKAVLAEREACADIAENWRCNGCPRTVLADQIRARGQE